MAATAIQNQLCASSNCKSLYGPPVLSRHSARASASESSSVAFVMLRGARSSASPAASARNSSGNAAKISSPEPSLPHRSLSNAGSSSSIFTSSPQNFRRSTARFAKVQGVGVVDEQPTGSQRVRTGKAAPKPVVMVDPVEAKRLAAAEMKAIQARASMKRRKEIEAINGGWAVLGLTAGLIIDGYTGKSILIQIAGYLDQVTEFLKRFVPPS